MSQKIVDSIGDDEGYALGNGIIRVSSDEIREEMYNGEKMDAKKQEKVFNKLYQRVEEHLSKGYSVVIDATNLNRRRRAHALNQRLKSMEDKLDIKIRRVAMYMAKPYHEVLERNAMRKGKERVPDGVMDMMYKTMDIPQYSEGFDSIQYEFDEEYFDWNEIPIQITESFINGIITNDRKHRNNAFKNGELEDYDSNKCEDIFHILSRVDNTGLCAKSIDFNQDNPHHQLTVDRHAYQVYENAMKIMDENEKDWDSSYNAEQRVVVALGALLHDIGKPVTQVENKEGHSSYYNHERVGAQHAIIIARRLNLSDEYIYAISSLVANHMDVYKQHKKGKPYDPSNYDYSTFLELLNQADKEGKTVKC